MSGTRLLSESDVEAALNVSDALNVVERTYVEANRDQVVNPAKLSMHLGDDGEWPDRNAFAINMPAYVDWLDAVGTKWAVATWDADIDVPISSLVLLFDLGTGRFEAVMEGMYLTGVRTALQSAVGLKHLLAAPPNSVGIFGAGFQATFQLHVIDELFDIDEFFIYDVDSSSAVDLTTRYTDPIDAELTICETPKVAAQSEAVLTVTDSKTPVLEAKWIEDARVVIALGSYRELPDAAIKGTDRLVVDHVDQCLQRGTLADMAVRDELSASDLDATIGEVLDNNCQTAVQPDDRTIFVPIGLGALDVAIADRIYNVTTSEEHTEFKFN